MKFYVLTFIIILAICSCDSSRKGYNPDEVISIRPRSPMQELFNYTVIVPSAWSSEHYDYDCIIEGKSTAGPTPLLDVYKGDHGTHYTIISLGEVNVIEGDYPGNTFVFGHTYSSHKNIDAEKPSFVGEFRVWIKRMSSGYKITHIEEISNQHMDFTGKTHAD